MEDEMKDIISDLIVFLAKCPYFKQVGFNVGEIRFINSISEANALQYTGTPQPTPHKDIYGNVWLDKQSNFLLLLSRRNSDDITSTTISNLLYNLETWVERENFLNPNIPRIGDDPLEERMWADNGRWFSRTEKDGIDIYQVQIHIKHRKYYNVEDISAEEVSA